MKMRFLYFNSNLVRLKVPNSPEKKQLNPLFQFQSGTIKGMLVHLGFYELVNFNSNLVRLKESGKSR